MNTKNLTFAVILVLLLGIIIVAWDSLRRKNEILSDKDDFILALQDTVTKWKDKDGVSHYKIRILETERTKDFLKIQFKDREIIKLQKLIGEYKDKLGKGGTATIIEGEIKFDTIYKPVYVKGDCELRDSVSNKWINFLYEYKEGVSHFDLKVKTDLSIVHGEESQGWFKPKRPFVEVKDANTYSEVKVLRSYRTKRRELDNWGIGPNVSFSVDKSFKPTVTVGIGIQRNFIHF